jgi:hypothetical protein
MDTKHRHETKFLGLHLAFNMKLDIHIENLSSKLGKSYYVTQPLYGITSVTFIFIFLFNPLTVTICPETFSNLFVNSVNGM